MGSDKTGDRKIDDEKYKCLGCGVESDHPIPYSWWTFEFCCRECWQLHDSRNRLSKPKGPDIFCNGKRLEEGTDYDGSDARNGVITLKPGALTLGTNLITIHVEK